MLVYGPEYRELATAAHAPGVDLVRTRWTDVLAGPGGGDVI